MKYEEVLFKLPSKELTLEKFMVFLSEWCFADDCISQSKIFKELNDIAGRVEENLRRLNPSHSLFKVDKSIREEWRVENIEGNQFNFKDSKQIILSMFDVLFGELGFSVYKWNYFTDLPNRDRKNYLSIDGVNVTQ